MTINTIEVIPYNNSVMAELCRVTLIVSLLERSIQNKYLNIDDIRNLLTDWYPFNRSFRAALRMLGRVGTYYNDRLYIVVCYGSMRHTNAVKDKKVCHNIVSNKEMKKYIKKIRKTKSVYETYIFCVDTDMMLYEWHDYLNDEFFSDFFLTS